jgi:hypothetical protein
MNSSITTKDIVVSPIYTMIVNRFLYKRNQRSAKQDRFLKIEAIRSKYVMTNIVMASNDDMVCYGI